MITCYVIDDESHAVETLCDLILKCPELELIGHTTSPLVGLDFVTANAPNLTFLDINMPELSGIDFAALASHLTTIIFTTAHVKYAFEAFEREAFDYLLKPITKERFFKCLTKYKQVFNKGTTDLEEFFYIKGDAKGKFIRINTNDITYIEAASNYIIIHTSDGKTQITYLTMGEIRSYLHEKTFSRIHKSVIVNNMKIKSITGNDITLNDQTTLTIGSAYKETLLEAINKSLLKTRRSL